MLLLACALVSTVLLSGCLFGGSGNNPAPAPAAPIVIPPAQGPLTTPAQGMLKPQAGASQ